MVDVERRCMSCIILGVALFAAVSGQLFDKRPTLYDHMKSGANTVKNNLIDSELKIVTEYMPPDCAKIDDDNLYGDRDAEIYEAKEELRLKTAEIGDTVSLHFKVTLDSDGTVLDDSRKMSEELGLEDEEIPAVFTVGYEQVIPGWDIGVTGMCIGEKRKVTIPPQLAYGAKGYKPKNIPPDATLEIISELIKVKKKDAVDHYFDFLHTLHIYAFFILGLTFLLSGFYKSKIAEKRRMYREVERKKREKEE